MSRATPVARATLWRALRHLDGWLALGFGSGLVPVAPGTAGTLVGVVFYLIIATRPPAVYTALVAALFVLGILVCGRTTRRIGVHDHPAIVWDEVVGFLVTMIGVAPCWQSVAAGCLLFRVFDIIKPWPIRCLDQRVHGGFGIMLDDLVAGVFAGLVLHLGIWLAA